MYIIDKDTNYKPIVKNDNIYTVSWGLKPSGTQQGMSEWHTTSFVADFTPSPTYIKDVIVKEIDNHINSVINSCFIWKFYSVPLKQIDQLNYTAAYTASIGSNGASLPVTFKFVDNRYNKNIYYTFDNQEDFTDFYVAYSKFVNTVLTNGWEQKESINLADYKL